MCIYFLAELDAGQVGLALSYSITLMGMFQWGVRQSTEVENLVSVIKIFYATSEKNLPHYMTEIVIPLCHNPGINCTRSENIFS